jgi:hypothetical protein
MAGVSTILRCSLVACGIVSALVVAGAAPALRADGDPASDFLVESNVFLPLGQSPPANAFDLRKQVASVYAAGLRLKVAVIATRSDLGAIPSLFGKPSDYAAFLGDELSGIYVGPLLIVMPSGYGIYDGGRTTQAEQAVLASLPIPASARPFDLVGAAATAVAKLVQAGALTSPDILPPFVQVVSAVARSNILSVRFYLADDSEHAVGQLSVTERGHSVLTMTQVAAGPAGYVTARTRRIALPARLGAAPLSFCVTAVDPAGNRSGRSCRPVTRRRVPAKP